MKQKLARAAYRLFLSFSGQSEEAFRTTIYEEEKQKHLVPQKIYDIFIKHYGTALGQREFAALHEISHFLPVEILAEQLRIQGLLSRWWVAGESLFRCIENIVMEWQGLHLTSKMQWVKIDEDSAPTKYKDLLLLYKKGDRFEIALGYFNGYFRTYQPKNGTPVFYCELPELDAITGGT